MTRYRIKPGKEDMLKEWIRFANENKADELLAMRRGRMFLKTVFLHRQADEAYLFYYVMARSLSYAVEKFIERNDRLSRTQWKFIQECIEFDPEPAVLDEQFLLINEMYFKKERTPDIRCPVLNVRCPVAEIR